MSRRRKQAQAPPLFSFVCTLIIFVAIIGSCGHTSKTATATRPPTVSATVIASPTDIQTPTPSPTATPKPTPTEEPIVTYILNRNTGKFHYQDCDSVRAMKEKNKVYFTGTYEEAIKRGYEPCERCMP